MVAPLDLISVLAVLSCTYCSLTARTFGLTVCTRTQYPHMATYLALLSVFAFLSCMYRPMTACMLDLAVCIPTWLDIWFYFLHSLCEVHVY